MTKPNATIERPSSDWIEINIDNVQPGAIAIDLTKTPPQLVFTIDTDNAEDLRKTHSETGETHNTTTFAVPLAGPKE